MTRLALLLFAFPSLAWSADPPAPAPPPVILPPGPAPIPPPPPPPNSPVNLLPGTPYVIRLNVPATTVASPEGFVKICPKAEPITICTADGTCTDYAGDKVGVVIVSAVKTGLCELIIVPSDGSATVRVQLAVGGGPPPTPPPPPGPTDPLALTLQADFIVEADPAKAANVVKLAALYRSGVGLQNATAPPTTYADLFGTMEQAAVIALPKGAIPKIQGHVAADIKAALPGAGAIDWTATAKEFNRVAGILEGLPK